ncbi:MAG: capsule assembly Wzi family protein [Gemmatimonadaceae bacterium]
MLIAFADEARAQPAATVPASSAIYHWLESVTAWYPSRDVPLGVRPLSRTQVVRIVARLRREVEADNAGNPGRRALALRQLAAIDSALDAEPDGAAITGRLSLAMEFFGSNARLDTIKSNGLGSIDAVSHPFGDLRQGWPSERGAIVSVAPTAALGLGHRLAIVVQPRASVFSPPASNASAELVTQRAYVRGVVRNVALRAGADEVLWGQSSRGALFIAGNAMPLMAITVGTDAPVVLPWLFRLAGPVSITGMVADLGRAQDPPHTKLAGWHVAMQPWARFELGVSVLAQQGGRGGPEASLVDRVLDLFPLIDALDPRRGDYQFSNKLAGGNLRLRFPELSGLDLHYELLMDDFDLRRFESTVVDDFSHLVGLRLPLLVGSGQLVLHGEVHNMGLRLYEHAQFRSGVTFRDRLIGSPLGPNAKGAYLSVRWQPSPRTEWEVTLADESRDPSLYTATASGAFDEGFVFIRQTDDPRHRRRRVTSALSRNVPGGAVRMAGGYNHAWRSGEPPRGAWLGQVSFTTRGPPSF